MINGQKIGCGIVTYNRPDLLRKLVDSLPAHLIDCIVIVNDGHWYDDSSEYDQCSLIHNESNLGVGKSKNKALAYLMDSACDHLFLIEDDIFIKDESVFERYILMSQLTGIQHFNFSQHGNLNKDLPSQPKPVCKIEYGNSITLPLYRHCVGAFSYYSRLSIETVHFMDENFHNAFEHVDHTLSIIKSNMHPDFWFFADIEDSHLFLGDKPWTLEQSTISSKPEHKKNIRDAILYFQQKHGYAPLEYPVASAETLMASLQRIRDAHGIRF
ncbi:glycosyltransferase [Pseudomonas viridiflava]|uniref:glycosyltransferase family 2 protein n=1 Tax=Pseudomonas syringae group TaxID=136849 RepID=UPI0010C1092B|nr:glycosyltransferase [Pseudomonas viridiflava]MBD8186776.1 glycosyltransferase [Pseudomonas viridiflava]MBD8200134.1 glycosyltransferase [Pseudomonas viridiflava]MCJ8177149.1 glycosyltransferase [Pseudomonas viridiflava]MEE4092205.1 glycosyltransferase [Pseudomonas viridiflava]TKJ66434.1 glycosyltransferase subfamily GT2 protein [Pseudomonas viridiflava]